MQVRIQLIRDDGSVVLSLSGDAVGPLVWNSVHDPSRQIVLKPGLMLEAFVYEASVLRQATE